MNIKTLVRVAEILRAQPDFTMPLLKLHARLVAELGPDAGSYVELCRELKNRPQSFMLLDMPRLLGRSQTWPHAVREAYEEALDGAGLGACMRVALTELPSHADSTIALAQNTIGELSSSLARDATMSAALQKASAQLADISSMLGQDAEAERPTTRPRGPRR